MNQKELTEILAQHDPIGLIRCGAPRDEYDPEASDMIQNFPPTHGLEEMTDFVHDTFIRWFDEDIAGGRNRYQTIARELLSRRKPD